MIWYKQITSWLGEEVPNWTAQQVYDFSKSYILALSSFSSVKIDEWDIINEAITKNDFRRNTWYDIVSSQKNDEGDIGFKPYFVKLFKWARQADADVELFYND